MNRESTNVDAITVVGGEVISDPNNDKTIIPPTKSVEKDSPKEDEVLTIKLEGKWPPEKDNNKGKEEDEDRDK